MKGKLGRYTRARAKSYGVSKTIASKKEVPKSGSSAGGVKPLYPVKPEQQRWRDPLGLGRPDPSSVDLYRTVEGRDGLLYMNVGDRWVIPGESNWRQARQYSKDFNLDPNDYFSGFRYNYPRGRVVELPGYSYGPLGPY